MNCKTYLSFKLPDQQEDLNHALNGYEYKREIEDFFAYLRSCTKYESFDFKEFQNKEEIKKLSDRDIIIVYSMLRYLKDKLVEYCPRGVE